MTRPRSPFDPRDPLARGLAAREAPVPFSLTALVLALLGFTGTAALFATQPACYCFDFPRAATSQLLGRVGPMDVGVDRDGHVYVDDHPVPVPDGELGRRLSELRARRPAGHRMVVGADRNAPYGRVLRAAEAVAADGNGEVVLLTSLPRQRSGS